MFQQGRAKFASGLIADPSAITVLASPVRQELVDTVEALGGVATIAELAEQLGRPADGLYYHVEILRRAGLLVAAAERRSRAGRNERRYGTPTRGGKKLALVYQPHDTRNATAVRGVVGSMLRIARRDFDRALTGDVTVDGPRRELWAARGTGWVSDAELAEINRLLIQLSGHLRRPRGGPRQRLISLCFVVAPMPVRPKRRQVASARPRATTRRPARRTSARSRR
jgi:DNA-binding transcriptional ArsR family regulator